MIDKSEVVKWRVLVVDDEPDSIDLVRMVLSAAGAKVYTASNGKQGLAIYEREHPTMVLADISMPEMDGTEMLRCIREREASHQPPVIALTAHAMVGDRERFLKLGFDGYLSKPLKLFTFLEDLIACLDGNTRS